MGNLIDFRFAFGIIPEPITSVGSMLYNCGDVQMPVRTEKAVVSVPVDAVSTLVPGNSETNGEVKEKSAKEKALKPVVVYAEPIQELTEVIYPTVCVTVCGTPEQHGVSQEVVGKIQEAFRVLGLNNLIAYAPPLTAVDAIGLIGWEVEQKDGPKFGEEYSLKDYYDKKVRLLKNLKNRPIYHSNLETIQQNMLMKRWELNGEPTIISDVGNVLDNQHTLISLILAQQRLDYEKNIDNTTLKWIHHWPEGIISIPKVIVYGIKGSESVVNSMNTGKPRNFTDVLYRSPYFSKLPARSKDGVDRQTAARVTDHAVREIWVRMWMYLNSYGNRLTNMEGANWIEAHGGMEGKFLECVRFILDEDTHGHISRYISCGKAVSLMWLSAVGKSSQEKYYILRNNDKDEEAYMTLNWSNWKLAVSFWKEFGDREPDKVVHAGKENETTVEGKSRGPLKALTDLLEKMNNSDEPMVYEKDFVIARAWNLWCEEKPVTETAIKIKDTDYTEADKVTGTRQLVRRKHLRFGELDLGIYREKLTKTLSSPQQEEVNNRINEVKSKNLEELQKREDDADMTTTSGQLGSLKPQTQQDCEALQVAYPDIQVILMKTVSGKCECWGVGATLLGGLMGVVPSQHPNDSYYIKFGVDDWEVLTDKANGAGYVIGLGDKVDGKLEIVMTSRPAKPVSGHGQKKR